MLTKNKALLLIISSMFAANGAMAADVTGLISGKESVVKEKGVEGATKKIVSADPQAIGNQTTTADPLSQDPTSATVAKSPIEETKVKGGLTIDRLAAKQVRLTEMEIDSKIQEMENKKSGKGLSLPAIPSLTRGIPLSSVDSLPKIGGNYDKKVEKKPTETMPVIVAIYGRSSDLTADVSYDNKTFVLKRGSGSAGGWVINSINTNSVVMSNGKKTKTFQLEIAQMNDELSDDGSSDGGGATQAAASKVKITLPGGM